MDIKSRIERTSQYSELRNDYVSKVKQTYKFMEYRTTLQLLWLPLTAPSSIMSGVQIRLKAWINRYSPSAVKTYTQDDRHHLQVKQRTSRDRDIQGKFAASTEASRDNMLIEYDMSARNEDFRRLMQGVPRRYSAVRPAGTESMDRSCAGYRWSEAFYDMHKSDYMWEEGWTPAFISALTLLLPKLSEKW